MSTILTHRGRRSFLKSTALAGGGMLLGFNWLTSCSSTEPAPPGLTMPDEWFDINAYLKIGDNGVVTIMSPNPEFGQNIKTSMPMIVAEELDVDWNNVIVEQAPFDTTKYTRQFAGGSASIRSSYDGLRLAGATARHMLRQAAADAWQLPLAEITTAAGMVHHAASGQSASYGTLASAAAGVSVPEEVELKNVRDFGIIGTSRKNVEAKNIITGKPLFGIDYRRDGMLIAMIAHPPAFGMKLKSFDGAAAEKMPGINKVFSIETFPRGFEKGLFDTVSFTELVAVVGETTWQVMQAKQVLEVEWEPITDVVETMNIFGNIRENRIPGGLESTEEHERRMEQESGSGTRVSRRDGDPEAAFARAAQVIERTYTAPFLAHNCMEPMNFFAHFTDEKLEMAGPLQAPEFTESTLAARFDLPKEKIDIHLTRMGGGFGRRAYGHYLVEAALISQQAQAPIKLIYTREDDMTCGIYRPSYHATYRAALDEAGKLIGLHVKAGGVPESPLFANRFPAGAVDHYLAEEWSVDSNISIGAFRAPRSNFMSGAEQAFLDEVAEAAGKDPIDFRLELLQRARENPVGENNDYDAARYAGVLELVREKSDWDNTPAGASRGVSAYFCHNTYVAQVLDLTVTDGKPTVDRVSCAVDCGIVINPDAATNMAEGAIVDGVGNALYGQLTFRDGVPDQQNFDDYRMIRIGEAPRSIDVHFVRNEESPTGMGEPPFPPVFGAVANALYRATGERHYRQPFLGERELLG
ncbi:molybdopterin cofactor-binding domain-containing protein [Lewinella sp. JB7]|uniref:xanthine dehydrogenase family protein molybdopterin-binding subunit n=1 Tax=Lewinella sp. JB7 TaxID=2962887 RepID=UPI0020C93D14|nr:molybdopterin cofactor-binding domain-containing protein [Lewinella sp. JB7]MCP9235248.1 molybdopterin-dependent oxidoreductase [Lewinella sp. JB7]